MDHAVLAGLLVAGLAALGTIGNEASHGGLSEAMGLGHHHLADYGGYHCASHDGPHADDHLRHMHGDHPMRHDDCPGGSGMHHMDGGMGHG